MEDKAVRHKLCLAALLWDVFVPGWTSADGMQPVRMLKKDRHSEGSDVNE